MLQQRGILKLKDEEIFSMNNRFNYINSQYFQPHFRG